MVTLPLTTAAPHAKAQAAPAASAPRVVYSENFENISGNTPTSLTSYTSASGVTYTANAAWLPPAAPNNNCNGVIVTAANTTIAIPGCQATPTNTGATGNMSLRALASALGTFQGNGSANKALAAFTDTGAPSAVNPGANLVQFQMNSPITLSSNTTMHYITVSVNVATINCPGTNPNAPNTVSPKLQFNLLNSANQVLPIGGIVDPCVGTNFQNIQVPLQANIGPPVTANLPPCTPPVSSPNGCITARVGTFSTSAALAFTGGSVRLQLVNAEGSGFGNDAAIDNITMLDATPDLSKSFVPGTQIAGLPSRLTFTITNTTDLLAKSGWTFTDNLPSGVRVANPPNPATTCSSATFNPASGATSLTATGSLAAGVASCTVSVDVTGVAGTYANGPANITTAGLIPPTVDSPVTFVPPAPAITVTKTPTPSTATSPGTTINYSFVVTNTGNVDLSNVLLTDAQAPPAGAASTPNCPSTTLAVGASMTCTATYVTTLADVDHGAVNDTATVTGSPPTILNLGTVSATANATVTIAAAPALSMTKSVSPGTVTAAGTPVTYTFGVTNTGNVTVHGIAIADTTFTGSGALSPITCLATTLAPNASTTCTATYTITQVDMDAGHVNNTAHATGLDPSGSPVNSPSANATVTATQTPALKLVKSAALSAFRAGQNVTYTFEVTNTGNVTVHGINIVETAFSGTGALSPITCLATTLAPGDQTTCTATYTLTVADTDAGHVTNTAHAAGTTPGGSAVTSPPSTVDIPVTQAPALSLTKTATPATVTKAGDTVTYDFDVTNTGNVTIHGISVADTAFSGTGTPSAITCTATTLVPGGSTSCTATYTITVADMDAGKVTNTAVATGTAPNNATVTSPPATATVTATQSPVLAVVKSVNPDTVTTAGTTVTYTFAVTNPGNVTIHGINIAESAFTGTGTLSPITCTATTLAPGASTTCTATYVITQADVNAGHVNNTAHAAGLDPAGAAVTSPPSSATVTVTQSVALALSKSVSPSTVTAVGTTVTYTFGVTNNGNVTIHGINIDETAFSGSGALSTITCQATTLQPGVSTTCTATYDITQADMDAGTVTNTAHATGLAPTADTVTSGPATATVTATAEPALSLVKSASGPPSFNAGQVITYSFEVTNTGNVTIHGINIVETAFNGSGALSPITCPVTILAPGDQTTCTATYTLTVADIDRGEVTNTAHAAGTEPDGTAVTSPPSTVIVPQVQSPALAITKAVSPTTVTAAGDAVTYDFTVTNSGNVTIHGILIDETAFSGSGTISAITCTVTTLAPGEFTDCTASYTITQADMDARTVTNTAHATGTSPNGTTVNSPPATATVTATQAPKLTLIKSGVAPPIFQAGQVVTYSFEVTNTGNVTVRGIAIKEVAFSGTGTMSAITCPDTTLAPGDQTTCTATYAITQADINSGEITNTAVATGTAPDGSTVTSLESTVSIPQVQAPALALTKTATPDTVGKAGDTVTYTFEVTNAGNVTIHGIAITETAFTGTGSLSPITCLATTLAPGERTTCTATYTITQADMNAGKVTNSAEATGTAPNGAGVTSQETTATVTAAQAPALKLVKSASPSTRAAFRAGQVITYTFEVTNTGNVTVHGITIDETAFSGTGTLSPITCTITTLAPGEQTTCTATYTVTQADIDAGHLTNTAEATGTTPGGEPVTSPPSTVDVPQAQTPALALTKAVSPDTVTTAGTTVTYTFSVTNTGNVTVHGIAIDETAFTGSGTVSAIICTATTLAPGASTTCTATYTITQADVDAGTVTNTANATGLDPTGAAVTSPPASATVTASQSPALTVRKTASPATVNSAGDTVTYSFLVTNSGNVTAHGIAIDETAFSGTGTLSAITCSATRLAPGASTTCTATYAVTQADIDAGHVTNTAVATGLDPAGGTVTSPPSSATVTVSQATTLEVNKTVSPATVTTAGATVTYSFLVTNNGNVTISGITVSETAFSGTGNLSAITCPVTTLAPGASTTCTATYTVTQADIDAGSVTNTAVASGTAPDGTAVISPPSSSTLTASQAPALDITKAVSPTTVTAAGDAVTYSFTVTNSGNVTIHGIVIDETAFSGSGSLSAITCPVTTLAPGVSTTCTATYTITQADMDAGKVTNTAHAAGFTPDDAAVTSPSATATVTASSAPALSLVKSAIEPPIFRAGQVVTYNFAVTNTGNVTVDAVVIDETAFSGTGTLSPITCPVTTLVPGASTTCTATYTITQADIDAGVITNTAVATGTDPKGATVTSPPSSATVPQQPAPELSVTKSVAPATVTTAGTTVTYSFDVTNEGNVTIHGIAIDETAFSGTGTLSAITCTATTLAPGASTTCTATYTITQADIDAGKVTNTAHATGLDPTGGTVTSPPDTATVTASKSPVLTLSKTASPATVTAAGDTVTYSFDVANPGNVTVHGIVINETAFSGTGSLSAITCPVTTLAPGASTTCTATYAVTQADIDRGRVTNSAQATGLAPDGTAVISPPSAATVTATPAPALDVTKTASPATVTAAGDAVTYSFKVTNAGNVTVHGIVIDETAFSGTGGLSAITCPVTTLAPGVSTTCTATYTITQGDIDAGKVTNTAHAAGTAPDGAAVTSPDATATVTATAAPALTVAKSANPATVHSVGDAVTYTFKVTNTGNVTITGITIDDTAFSGTGTLSPITCPDTTLAPGEFTTCTASYTVTQGDIDAGKVTNTAHAAGTAPDGAAVTSPDATATVTATAAPALTVAKSANPTTVVKAGEIVTYTFTVTNTGNVTIHGIAIDETDFTGTGTLSPITCGVTTLDPGDQTTCTATYTITQADMDAGQVSNTAVATGSDPDGGTVTSPPSTETVTVDSLPALDLAKTVSPGTVTTAGTTVTYSFHVTNTGNLTITGIAIDETAFSGSDPLQPATCPVTTLAPGESTTCTATYIITQADIDAGQITNSAQATGAAPDGAAVLSPLATAAVVVSQAPALSITKVVSPATVSRAGATVTYTFTVTNSGNVTVHGVNIGETAFTGTGNLSPVSCLDTILLPGESVTCTATYEITQADIDAGKVTNTAEATGFAPDGAAVTSPPASAVVTVTQTPALSLVKSAALSAFRTGQTITYSFVVTNTGNVTITDIAIDETAFTGTGTLSPITCLATTLAPGEQTTCTATYAITQADIDAGEITNTAEADGTAPNGATVTSPPSTVTVPQTQSPALALIKTVSPSTVNEVGDAVTYSFEVTNTGNVTVTDIAIDEIAFTGTGTLSPITCLATTLAPGASTLCTATYTITQADIDAGHVTNSAEADGTAPNGAAVTSPPETATVTASQTKALALTKTVSPDTVTAAGTTVTYTFGVTNDGNVTIHAIAIDETAFTGTGTLSPITCLATTLAPGASTTCTATYTVTQADIDAGHVTNTARATGTAPDGTAVTSPPATSTVTVPAATRLTLAKSVFPATVTAAGDTVTYSFDVTNDSNVTVHGITVTDTAFSGTGSLSVIHCPVTTLAPGASTSCTATYTVTQADIDAGQVTNTAIVTGTAPDGTAVVSPPDTATLTASQTPALSIRKTANPAVVTVAGTTVTYTFGVTNTGNVTIHGISIDDTAFSGTGTLSPITCTDTTLAPGASTTCTATYEVTQADMDAGSVTNTAEATGFAPDEAAVTSPPASATVTDTPAPALTLVKSAVVSAFRTGQTITYSWVVTNTGNVTVHGIAIDETAFSGTGTLSPITCLATTLAPDQQTTCTATYTITQADIDAGHVTNTAEATGTAPDGTGVTSPPSTVTVPQTQAPALALTKTATPATVTAAGDTVAYSFEVTNTGNVTMTDIAIDETAFSGTGTLSPITCPDTTLIPGQITTCTATYTITQADMDAGHVTNTAHATGTAPNGATITSPDATATVTATPAPALSLVKSVSPSTVTTAGDTVTYTFEVTNTGNVTIDAIEIKETAFTGSGALSPITCTATTLAPGDHTTCTATYTITQADMDSGHVTNTAHAAGTAPDGATVTSPPATATVTETPAPALSLVKSVSPSTVTTAGDTVTYTFDVTNTGNVTIHAIEIKETAFTGSGALSAITCTDTTLAPGASTTCTATYTITQADMDGGHVINTAHAAGMAPDGAAVASPAASATVTARQAPALSLVKSASPAGPSVFHAGQTITYHFLVTNTGNVTIHAIANHETAFTGTGTLSPITCPATRLAPGEQTTCSATYTITQADIDAGHVTNTAHATGTAPDGTPVTSPPSTATVPQSHAPALSLRKTGSPATVTRAGERVTYRFAVTNTGNVTIHAVSAREIVFTGSGALSAISCPATALAPGGHTTCTATYTITQADIDAGHVTNTAHATGTAPNGAAITSPPSSARVTARQLPALTIVKKANTSTAGAGQQITYSFAVTNTGNVTVHAITIDETAFTGTGTLSPVNCPVTTLAPGASATCTATYVVTEADVDAGTVTNTATATGKLPSGKVIASAPSTTTVKTPKHGVITTGVPGDGSGPSPAEIGLGVGLAGGAAVVLAVWGLTVTRRRRSDSR